MNTPQNGIVVALLAFIAVGIAGGTYVLLTRDTSCSVVSVPPPSENSIASEEIPGTDLTIPQVVIPSSIDLAYLRGTIGAYEKQKRGETLTVFDSYGDIDVLTTGTRYILYHVASLKEEGGAAVFNVFNLSEKKTVHSFVAAPVLKTSQTLIFATNSKSLCAYKPDTSLCEPLNGSTLQNNEEYWDPMGNPIEVTAHTDTSFTITVWSGYKERAREVTYQIP